MYNITSFEIKMIIKVKQIIKHIFKPNKKLQHLVAPLRLESSTSPHIK